LRHGALAALSDMSLQPLVHAALIKVYGCPAPDDSAPSPVDTSTTDMTNGS